MATLQANGDLLIEDFNFGDFLAQFQQAVLDGYELDLVSNDRYPQKFGDHLYVILKPTQWEPVAELVNVGDDDTVNRIQTTESSVEVLLDQIEVKADTQELVDAYVAEVSTQEKFNNVDNFQTAQPVETDVPTAEEAGVTRRGRTRKES